MSKGNIRAKYMSGAKTHVEDAAVQEFLLRERAMRDSIDVKRIYIDIAGDLAGGVFLSQLLFWYIPGREGKSKLRVERNGQFWVAKKRSDWWDECRITEKQFDRIAAHLSKERLIETANFKFRGERVKHVRIHWPIFLKRFNALLEQDSDSEVDER
jgi:hypothetical protein